MTSVITLPGVKKPKGRIAERQTALRSKLWPNITPDYLWLRQHHDGFTTIPRTMPLLMSIMDDLEKGKPVSSTYLELWARAFDEGFVTLSKSQELAFAAGFTGQRGERTWRERMTILAQYGFIDVKAGPAGAMSYALIYNPYLVVRHLRDSKKAKVREDKYNTLIARANEIGARDFDIANPLVLQTAEQTA